MDSHNDPEYTFSQRLLCINIVRDQCQIDGDHTTESHRQEGNDMGWGLERWIRGSGHLSQDPHDHSQLPTAAVPENQCPLVASLGSCMQVMHINLYRQTHIHIKLINLEGAGLPWALSN